MVLSNQNLNMNKTMELGNQYKHDLYQTNPKVKVIIDSIEIVLSVPYLLMATKTRQREISYARQLSMYFLRKHTDLTLNQIGLIFGGRNHATILHAVALIEDLKFQNIFKGQFESAKELIEINLNVLSNKKYTEKVAEINKIIELSKTQTPEIIANKLLYS